MPAPTPEPPPASLNTLQGTSAALDTAKTSALPPPPAAPPPLGDSASVTSQPAGALAHSARNLHSVLSVLCGCQPSTLQGHVTARCASFDGQMLTLPLPCTPASADNPMTDWIGQDWIGSDWIGVLSQSHTSHSELAVPVAADPAAFCCCRHHLQLLLPAEARRQPHSGGAGRRHNSSSSAGRQSWRAAGHHDGCSKHRDQAASRRHVSASSR